MKFFIIIFILITISCNNSDHKTISTKTKENLQVKTIDTSIYTILKFDKVENYYFDKNVKSATISPGEVGRVGDLIDKAVTNYNKNASEYEEKITGASKYFKQLIVVVNSKGEKIVWVNCFCSPGEKSYWKRDVVLVADGGSCYFNLKINLTTGIVYNFMVNGVA